MQQIDSKERALLRALYYHTEIDNSDEWIEYNELNDSYCPVNYDPIERQKICGQLARKLMIEVTGTGELTRIRLTANGVIQVIAN